MSDPNNRVKRSDEQKPDPAFHNNLSNNHAGHDARLAGHENRIQQGMLDPKNQYKTKWKNS